MNASNEDEPSSLVHAYMTGIKLCKDKDWKTVGHVAKNVSKEMYIFIKFGRRVEMKVNGKRRYSKDLQQGGLEIPSMFSVSSEHEKLLRRFEEYAKDIRK